MKDHTPAPSDDRETAEQKSRSVDERIPDQATAPVPAVDAPGAPTMPYAGLGVSADPVAADRGPGEAALEKERSAQRSKIQPG